MFTSSDELALLAAIREHPDEDTPRLMLADWLEQYGDASPCARAELIKVQCELAKLGPAHKQLTYAYEGTVLAAIGDRSYSFSAHYSSGLQIGDKVDLSVFRPLKKPKMVYGFRVYKVDNTSDPHDWKVYAKLDENHGPWAGTELKSRESAILAQYADKWRKASECGWCDGSGILGGQVGKYIRDVDTPCVHCNGTGDSGGLMRQWTIDERHDAGLLGGRNRYYFRVEYVRGMKRVRASMQECVSEKRVDCQTCKSHRRRGARSHLFNCLVCNDVGYKVQQVPSDWLLSVVRHHPDVVEVWVENVPFMEPGRFEFRLRRNGGILPQAVEDLIYGHDASSAESAPTALARAIPAWAHSYLTNSG